MFHQRQLKTPDIAETVQPKTHQPQKDEDNMYPPESSSSQLPPWSSHVLTEPAEIHEYNVEVRDKGWKMSRHLMLIDFDVIIWSVPFMQAQL